jgi:hypothetical protein
MAGVDAVVLHALTLCCGDTETKVNDEVGERCKVIVCESRVFT